MSRAHYRVLLGVAKISGRRIARARIDALRAFAEASPEAGRLSERIEKLAMTAVRAVRACPVAPLRRMLKRAHHVARKRAEAALWRALGPLRAELARRALRAYMAYIPRLEDISGVPWQPFERLMRHAYGWRPGNPVPAGLIDAWAEVRARRAAK